MVIWWHESYIFTSASRLVIYPTFTVNIGPQLWDNLTSTKQHFRNFPTLQDYTYDVEDDIYD